MKRSTKVANSRFGLSAVFVAAIALGGVVGLACSVSFPDDARYVCGTREDCGGGDFVCAPSGFCCKPEPERCDGIDTDCDGVLDNAPTDLGACYTGDAATRGVGRCKDGQEICETGQKVCQGQVGPGAEQCNTIDDDCDGAVDENFDFQTDPNNCGQCRAQCVAGQTCMSGTCPLAAEVNCGDGVNEDGDANTDCDDGDCINESCGAGCRCTNYDRAEITCDDATDNDGDNLVDCADPDCTNRFCEGTAKRCISSACTASP